MNYVLRAQIFFSVVHVSATTSLHANEGRLLSSDSYSLVLRAAHDTNIVLCTGSKLSDIDIHFTFSTKWGFAKELDRDLESDDVGFLAHSGGGRDGSFVHGGALLLSSSVVASLLDDQLKGEIRLEVANLPFLAESDTPFVWEMNRRHMLRISHLEVSAIRGR
nr:hypothetical protein [uncultured Duganella sp.]